MIASHKLMGENILKYSTCEFKDLINKNRFIWGNVKPDCVFKYKCMRHYYDESIDIIIGKIHYLSSITLEQLENPKIRKKFSEELGIVCHFLCDYFCAPHYYRWRCKSTKVTKEHMIYEQKLAKVIKTYIPKKKINLELDITEINDFLNILLKEYNGEINYNKDLRFAYYSCESLVNMILNIIASDKKTIKDVI